MAKAVRHGKTVNRVSHVNRVRAIALNGAHGPIVVRARIARPLSTRTLPPTPRVLILRKMHLKRTTVKTANRHAKNAAVTVMAANVARGVNAMNGQRQTGSKRWTDFHRVRKRQPRRCKCR